MYQISSIHLHAEKDNWKTGCDPDTTYSTHYDYRLTAPSIPTLINQVMLHAGTADRDSVMLNACGSPGRIDIQVLAHKDKWIEASPADLEKFKRNKIELWLCTYTAYIEEINEHPRIPSPEENEELRGYHWEEMSRF